MSISNKIMIITRSFRTLYCKMMRNCVSFTFHRLIDESCHLWRLTSRSICLRIVIDSRVFWSSFFFIAELHNFHLRSKSRTRDVFYRVRCWFISSCKFDVVSYWDREKLHERHRFCFIEHFFNRRDFCFFHFFLFRLNECSVFRNCSLCRVNLFLDDDNRAIHFRIVYDV
jgi:hypothetical protein